jgi:nitric oxide reductase subunit B
MEWTVWLRIPGDVIFTIGALAMMAFVVQAIWAILRQPTQNQPELAEVKEAIEA